MHNVKKVIENIASRPLTSSADHRNAGLALSLAIHADMDLGNKQGTMAIKELMTGSGLPSGDPVATLERFQAAQLWDNGYEAVFKSITLNAPHTSWEIYTGGTGITFQALEAGGEIRMSRQTGAKVTASVEYYAAGFEILQQWVENQQWWNIEEAATDFVNAYNTKKAETYYGLIDAVGSGQNLAWNTTGANELAKDVATINTACTEIITDMKDKGFFIGQNQPFVLVTPYQLRDRINAALGQMGATGDNRATYGQLQYNIVPVATTFLTATDKFYVCLPGRKNQSATRKELTSEKARNIINLSDVEVRYAAWGGTIADEEQFQRASTS